MRIDEAMIPVDWSIIEDAPQRTADSAEHGRQIAQRLFGNNDDPKHEAWPELRPQEIRPRPVRGHRRAKRAALLVGSTCLGVLVGAAIARMTSSDHSTLTQQLPPPAAAATAVTKLPPPNLLKPLSPQEAAQENAERPFVNRPDTPASKFVLRTDAADRDRALTCMTQAVYYEAASEGVDGGRAVAQVVLNRMHHPGYPASVCGVVYQGSVATGCQFTFTCDGSLLRTPIASLWARSRKIAEEALAGRVFTPVGHATHYHADYVLPYWADSLDKTVQIGRHIFYRLRSSAGDKRSFFQHYAGTEPQVPQPGTALVIPPAAVTDQLASALISDQVTSAGGDVEKAAGSPGSPLLVDSSSGTLIADAQTPAPPVRKAKPSISCSVNYEGKQIAPLGANDMRASASISGC